jgi:hypothetical protein
MKIRFQQLGVEIAYPSETRIIAEELPARRNRAPRSAAQ